MEIYIVGGYCRDTVMGKIPHDRDFVVVGGTPEELKKKGFILIHGTKFPVFINPETKDEYALARKEIKTGNSHQDFEFVFTPDITLEEDLYRRDFTINTLVMNERYEIVKTSLTDQAISDINNKIIRMVSKEHFAEDPLRAVRAIRFASTLGFTIEPETEKEVRKIIKSEDFQTVPKDRIRSELDKCIDNCAVQQLFEMFHDFGIWSIYCSEVEELWNSPENPKWHPEGNTAGHTANAIKFLDNYFKNFSVPDKSLIYFGTMFHDIGKPFTDKNEFPKHHDHDSIGLYQLTDEFKDKLRIDNKKFKFIRLVAGNHMNIWKWFDMNDGTRTDMVLELTQGSEYNCARQKVKNFLLCCMADHFGQPLEDIDYYLAESALDVWTDDIMLGYKEMIETKLSEAQLEKTKNKPQYRSQQLRLNRIKVYNDVRNQVRMEEKLSRSIKDLEVEELKKYLNTRAFKINRSEFPILSGEY